VLQAELSGGGEPAQGGLGSERLIGVDGVGDFDVLGVMELDLGLEAGAWWWEF
jgi:hypothetical protein